MAKILIIDDDAEILALLEEILKREAHSIIRAADAVEGMRKTREFNPDLIILDYHMPGSSGAHLFESLRRNESSRLTPILFMSGEAKPERIRQEIADAENAQFLAKPIHLEEFRAMVNQLLTKKTQGKLVLVRHGQSQWNLENRFTGWVDVPITPAGAQEAQRVGRELKGLTFDIAFTSLLQRAQQTLALILEEIGQAGIPIEKSQALNERHYGDLQGLNKTETAQKYGEAQVHQWRRSYDIRPPGGESLKDTADRAVPYFQSHILPLVKAGKNVIVSAHGNSLRAIIMALEGLTPEQIIAVEIGTGRPLIYEIDAAGHVLSKTAK